ncbi:MAG: lipoyl(octanoyl) transferase LipB [Chloroflexi bacterium]|nr:lipoyl(octanoyl) transferase LipB [Chloroflexota bacterium]
MLRNSVILPCEVLNLGLVPYQEAWDLQNRLAAARQRDTIPDHLLLLQHPHTYTLGSSGREAHLLMSAEERARRGVSVLRVDRGGDITYHGPGQVVGYPIIRLPRGADGLRSDFVGYVRALEQVLIATLADFGVAGKTIAGLTGVWVDTAAGEQKIAAIGVKIDVHAITRHGFALNVCTDLAYFEGIIPCGIRDKGVTSLAALLGQAPALEAVAARAAQHFGARFGFALHTSGD